MIRQFKKHIKTGGLYQEIDRALWEPNLCEVVIYMNVNSGQKWVRPSREWDDSNRFRYVNIEDIEW